MMNTKQIDLPFENEFDEIERVSFDQQGKYIAISCQYSFYIYSLNSLEKPVLKFRSGDPILNFGYPLEFQNIDSISFSQDSTIIAVSGELLNSNKDFVLLYHIEKNECIFIDQIKRNKFRIPLFIDKNCIYQDYNHKNLISFNITLSSRKRIFDDDEFKKRLWEDDKESQTYLDDNDINYRLFKFDFDILKFSQNFFYVKKYYNTESDTRIVRTIYEFSLGGTYQKISNVTFPYHDHDLIFEYSSSSISNNSNFIASASNNSNQHIIFESYNNQCKELDKFVDSYPIPIYYYYNLYPFWVVSNYLKYYVNNSQEYLYLGDVSEDYHLVHINSRGNLIALIGNQSIKIVEQELTNKKTPQLFQPQNKRIYWTEFYYEQLCDYLDTFLKERLNKYIDIFQVDKEQITNGLDELKKKLGKVDLEYNSPGITVAYAFQYLPRKIIVAIGVLEYYFSDYNISAPRNILDIGSGSDPVSMALGLCFPDKAMNIKAIEPSKAMRDLGQMCNYYFSNLNVLNVAASIGGCWLEYLNENYYDLVIMSSVLQPSFENQEEQWKQLAKSLYQSSTKEAKVIVIEPKTKKKLIEQMRQKMIEAGWNVEKELSLNHLYPEINNKKRRLEALTELQIELIQNYRNYPVETWNDSSKYNEYIKFYSKP